MTTTTMTREAETINTNNLTTAANQVVIGGVVTMSGLIGVWGVACLISGIAKAGGIIGMMGGYFSSIGM